ncbi:MAG: fructose-bisphosphatase class II [Leptospiraceae bacterium]|nr:fructose-bisphosphatase class II [Leptospiraceae bacterium]
MPDKLWIDRGKELAWVTDSVARSVIELSGKNAKNEADHICVEAMREGLNDLPYKMTVVIGEGEKDEAPMLYSGEVLGAGGEEMDLIVDPLECTSNFAKGLPDSMTVILAAERGSVIHVPGTYMEQILIPLQADPGPGIFEMERKDVLKQVSDALDVPVKDLTVIVQNRPRHENLIEDIRSAGASVALIESGSISAACDIFARSENRYHMLWGSFGAPEGLVLGFLSRANGYRFYGRIDPHNEKTEEEARELGVLGRVLRGDEWIAGSGVLVMTGLHDSTWLRGVRRSYRKDEVDHKTTTVIWSLGQKLELECFNGRFH